MATTLMPLDPALSPQRISRVLTISANLLPYVVDADIHADVLGSDHCPVSLTLALG